MRNRWTALFVLMHIAGLGGAATAQTLDQRRCSGLDADLSISGCAAMIQSGHETRQNLTIAFFNRGNAYYLKRQPDRAIEDLDQAIRLVWGLLCQAGIRVHSVAQDVRSREKRNRAKGHVRGWAPCRRDLVRRKCCRSVEDHGSYPADAGDGCHVVSLESWRAGIQVDAPR
jgi:hypothetical protein